MPARTKTSAGETSGTALAEPAPAARPAPSATETYHDGEASYYSDAHSTLGDRIAAARQKASLTQAGLAARLGVGAKIVSAWENDRSEPRANRLSMLSGLLGVSVAWLLTGRGEGVDPPATPEGAKPAGMFHLTTGAPDLAEARRFYGDLLGCPPGRVEETRQHFTFFGAWLTVDLDAPRRPGEKSDPATPPFAAIVLEWPAWTSLIERLRAENAAFALEPTIRRVGAPDEEGVFQIIDPAGQALEFRAYSRPDHVL